MISPLARCDILVLTAALTHLGAMSRIKTLSDAEVLREARRLYAASGARAMSFGNLSRATGLAASTLVQRFDSVEGLQAAAAQAGWQELLLLLDEADAATAGKPPQALLKALAAGAVTIPHLQTLGRGAEAALALSREWRGRVESSLALRIGQGVKSRAAAQALFLAWQGKLFWGAENIRIKDLAKLLQ